MLDCQGAESTACPNSDAQNNTGSDAQFSPKFAHAVLGGHIQRTTVFWHIKGLQDMKDMKNVRIHI